MKGEIRMKKLSASVLSVLLSAVLLASSPAAAFAAALPTVTAQQESLEELGLLSGVELGETVTRAQFAQLLVNAAAHQSGTEDTSAVSRFNDVSSSTAHAAAVYTAVDNGWMSGYLGGWFRPEQAVTLREAAYACLAVLGYTDADFPTGAYLGRQTASYSAGLLDDVDGSLDGALTSSDCVSLLYNLLCADTKQGALFGAGLGCALDEDGELDLSGVTETATNTIRGPYLVEESLDDTVPFSLSLATVFLDGDYMGTGDELTGDYADCAVYYSSRTRTVWIYEENFLTGEVTGVRYDLSGSLTPTAIYVNGEEYLVPDGDLADELSGGSAVRVGDEATLLFDEDAETGTRTLRDLTVE